MFLLSFVVEKSFIVNIIEKSEFWLNLAVNVCFTALFIVSFFSKNLKHAGKKIFFCVAVLSFVPLTYKLLFLKAMTVTDAKVLFFKSVVFFFEYCLLSVHGEYPCSENCAPKNNESSTFSTPVQVPHTPMYAQPTHSTMQTTLPPAPQSANYTPYAPYCPSSNLIPFSPLAVPPAPDPARSATSRKNVRIANVSEIPLRKTEVIKMGRLNKLNGEYLKQCLFSLEDKKLSEKDLVDFYSLKNDFLFTDGLLASGNRKEISDKCNRLIGLMSSYGV